MRYLYIILLFILPFTINSQKDVEILNDSFLIISTNKANSIKERTENLKKQIEILSQYTLVSDTIIKQSITKEVWYTQELQKWSKMDSIMREKVLLSNDIINNYKTLVVITEDQLKRSEKSRKRAEGWKNVYKPIALGAILYLGLNLLVK